MDPTGTPPAAALSHLGTGRLINRSQLGELQIRRNRWAFQHSVRSGRSTDRWAQRLPGAAKPGTAVPPRRIVGVVIVTSGEIGSTAPRRWFRYRCVVGLTDLRVGRFGEHHEVPASR